MTTLNTANRAERRAAMYPRGHVGSSKVKPYHKGCFGFPGPKKEVTSEKN